MTSLRLKFGMLLSAWALALSLPALADTLVFPYSSYPFYNPNQVTIFDKDFFKSKNPPSSSKAISGSERYVDYRPNYTAVQRESWVEACAKEKQSGMSRFRKCFENEKKRAEEETQAQMEEIRRKNNRPYRNVEWQTAGRK